MKRPCLRDILAVIGVCVAFALLVIGSYVCGFFLHFFSDEIFGPAPSLVITNYSPKMIADDPHLSMMFDRLLDGQSLPADSRNICLAANDEGFGERVNFYWFYFEASERSIRQFVSDRGTGALDSSDLWRDRFIHPKSRVLKRIPLVKKMSDEATRITSLSENGFRCYVDVDRWRIFGVLDGKNAPIPGLPKK